MKVSVVIPAHNEAENLAALVPEIAAALGSRRFKIVVVDDGSTDDTQAVLQRLAQNFPVENVRHAVPSGQSGAVWEGVRAADAPIIATLDGDGQNDPAAIPRLLAALTASDIGLVAGQRVGRRDTLGKRLSSRIANAVRGALLRDHTVDTGCGLKVFRRDAFLLLPYFDSMHRFLPALFLGDGWRVAHVDVVDRPRRFGASHYGFWDRLLVGIPDLFGVWWLLRRRRRSPFRNRGSTT